MRGPTNKLTDTKIESTLKQARKEIDSGNGKMILLGDGGGLTLQITKVGTASWLHRYMLNGKAKAIGLGPYPTVSLKMARDLITRSRQQIAEGKDPLKEKKASQVAERATKAKEKTFDECAAIYIDDHEAEWKNQKHAQQWRNTIRDYASPVIGKRSISEITTEDIVRILKPIWPNKNETASRLRGRIESVLDWATAHALRAGDNPARWKGHLEHLLAKSTPEQRAEAHHAAMPYADLPDFIKRLDEQEGMARWALEFLILTATRTSEVINAEWSEIDFDRKLWTIPAIRMKAGKEHRVPLVKRSLDILEAVKPFSHEKYIFAAGKKDQPLSNMAMVMLLRRMDIKDITVHGFRSTFRDYIAAETLHDYHTAEAALAHKLKDKVAAAYARSDLFDKRFRMMQDWADYCGEEQQ